MNESRLPSRSCVLDRRRRPAHLPSLGLKPVGDSINKVSNLRLVRYRTCGYLPGRRASLPTDQLTLPIIFNVSGILQLSSYSHSLDLYSVLYNVVYHCIMY